jgi:hypothetical protein
MSSTYAIVIPYGLLMPSNCRLTLPNNVKVLEEVFDPQGSDELFDLYLMSITTREWNKYIRRYAEQAKDLIAQDAIVIVRSVKLAILMNRTVLGSLLPAPSINREIIKAASPLGTEEFIDESNIGFPYTYSNCVEAIRIIRNLIGTV